MVMVVSLQLSCLFYADNQSQASEKQTKIMISIYGRSTIDYDE